MNLDLKDQVPFDSYFSFLKVNDQVYRIIVDRKYCNTEVIIGKDKAAVIDFSLGFGDILKAIRHLTDKPLIAFNTHCHIDHIGGNAQLGQPVYMGAEDIAALQAANHNSRFRQHAWDDRIARLGPESVQGMDYEEYMNRGNGELLPCSDGDVFDLGGLTLKVIATPGHSAGGRSFFIEELGILYTGDAVFATTLCFGRGASPRQQHIDTLKKILAVPFQYALSGHYIEPFDRNFFTHALYTAQYADFETGIPLANPISREARVCFAPGDWPAEEYIQRIKQGDHGLDNKVWAIVLSN